MHHRHVLPGMVGAAILLSGIILLFLGVPRLAAAAILAPWGDVRAALSNGEMIDGERLEEAYKAYGRALSWTTTDSDILRDRARIARRLTHLTEYAERTDELRSSALADLKAAAATSPSDAFVWAMIADEKLALGASFDEVSRDLNMSWLVGPYKASAMIIRFGLVMAHWDEASPNLRERAVEDAVALWALPQFRRYIIAKYIEADFEARSVVRDRLQARPDVREAFDAMLLRSLRVNR